MAAELRLAPALLDTLAEPVLVFEPEARLRFANRAALRLMPCEAGMPWTALAALLAAPVRQWLEALWAEPAALLPGQTSTGPSPAGATTLATPGVAPVLNRIDATQWLLCLPLSYVVATAAVTAATPTAATVATAATAAAATRPAEPMSARPVLEMADIPLRQLHAMLWNSPFPATLQDESFRLIDVNHAYADLVGLSRQQLVGRDPLELLPDDERERTWRERERFLRDPLDPEMPVLRETRLLDTDGSPLWVRAARYVTLTQDSRRLLLTLMQDTSAEHAAREQAERYSRELDQWFDLSPLGMALFDQGGLVLRANRTFEQLVGGPLLELREATPAVHALLHWTGTELALPLAAGADWVSSDAVLPRTSAHPDRRGHWVRALLRNYEGAAGQRRTMCMLEDRTAEEERDLAQLQLGTLVDTAGVGLATIAGPTHAQPSAPAPFDAEDRAPADTDAGTLMAQGVRRELVQPASMPEFERLQRAMQNGERYEARYAIVHPELGLRWLVSRVQPGRLSSGRPSTSVVTLDVTEQQRAQERAEQLLGEISTILENSPAGIASLRGTTLMHCNQRFERMLHLPLGAGVGTDIRALLATCTRTSGSADALASQLAHALEYGQFYEAELEVPAHGMPLAAQPPGSAVGSNWYALSIRRTGPAGEAPQAIAVLSEITRLKGQQVQLEALALERERMAQVLGQQADRTRAVLDSVLVGIVTVGEDGAISWLNRSARRMFGGDLGDFLGQSISAVATGDTEHPFRHSHALFEQLRDGEALQFECCVCARDGRTFWVVGNAVATLGASGARELVFALMDIEQRRQAEARVAQARESLQRIIEAAPMAITLFDARTLAVLQINRVAAESMGLSAEAAVGRVPEALYPPVQAARLRADLTEALATPEGVMQREHLIEHASGDKVWDVRYLPLSRASQPVPRSAAAVRVDQILLVASDVSAQRAAQKAELAAAIAQREMLVQEVHHRIKNNLQGVAGLLQQIGQRRPEVQPVIAEVVGQVQAIAQVYGLQVGGVGPLRVRQVVEAIAQSVARTFGREIVFTLQGDWAQEWSLPEAESIPIALTLNELLTNAIKHSPADAAVACRLLGEAGGVRIEIDNEGRLAADFRIDHRPSAVSGLGLVRALLPRRHAALAIEQRGARVVARVSLDAPVVKPVPAADPSSSSSSSSSSSFSGSTA